MKTIINIITASILLGTATAFAEGIDLEQYFAEKREYNKRIGREFDPKKYTKLFAKLDQNGDGLLTDEERNPASQTVKASYPQPEKDPAWFVESMKTRDQRLEWYKEAKFGMFVHWGVYSLLAGEWNGEVATGYSEHILRSHQIPLDTYAKMLPPSSTRSSSTPTSGSSCARRRA